MFHSTLVDRTVLICILAIPMLTVRTRAQSPSPSDHDSDKKEALRHITLDLAGRQPTEEETNAFLSDKSPHAYQSLLERLTKPQQPEKLVAEKLDREVQLLNDYTRLLLVQRVDGKPQAPAAYMGVGVDSPDDVLRSQLALPAGTGLVVNYVDPDGPSKEIIHVHDVLQKLDDQILINGEQFSTLVKMHKQGDEVSLTIIRRAQSTRITVKLGERETSSAHDFKVDQVDLGHGEKQLQGLSFTGDVTLGVDPNQSSLTARDVTFSVDANQRSVTAARTGPITFDDGKTTGVLLHTGDGNYITVFDKPTARLTFSGPVDTEQQWNSVPEDVRSKVILWHSLSGNTASNGQVNGVPVLSEIPIVQKLFVKPSAAPTPATQPAPAEK